MLNLHSLFVPFLALAGLVGPGWLGVMLAEDDNGRPSISEVVPDSPAAKAGIKPGDVIVALDETATDSVDVLVATVAAREAGSKIKVKLLRDGKQHVIEVELGQRPTDLGLPGGRSVRVTVPVKEKTAEQDKKAAKKEDAKAEAKPETKAEVKVQPKTGLAPRDAKPAGKPFLGVALAEEDGGVQVTDVLDGSPASRAGIDKGVLLSIAGTSIKSLADVDKVMSGLGAGQSVKISIRAGKETETVDVTLGSPPASPSKGEGREVASGAHAAASEAAAKAHRDAEGAERAARQAAEKAHGEAEKVRAEADKVRAEVAKVHQQAERRRAEQQETAQAEVKEAKAEAKESTKRVIAVAPQPASDKPTDKVDVRAALRDVKGKHSALLVFGAAWDSSTKALKKSLGDDKVKSALGDRKVLWIDTDQNGQVADEYGVQQIPHMVLLDAAGKRTGVIEGFQPAEILVQKLSASTGDVAKVKLEVEGEAAPAKKPNGKPAKPAKPAPERDLQEEVRALRDEIRELRGMLQELMRERRR